MVRPTREDVETALLAQMRAKGMAGAHFVDMAEDYMALYDRKRELLSDLASRGSVVLVEGPKGVANYKANPSLTILLKVNKSMNDLLKNLGLNEPDGVGDDDL